MIVRKCLFAVLLCLCASFPALAEEVQIFKTMEEGVSPMELRNQAQADAFAEVVLGAALRQLPAPLSNDRKEMLRHYFVQHAAPLVTGYKVLSTEATEAGLLLKLDVGVNYRALRDQLTAMGLTRPEPMTVALSWPEGTPAEAIAEVQGLAALNGFEVQEGVLPEFRLEQGPKNKFKARLIFSDREWVSIQDDLSSLWFDLWGRHFSRQTQSAANTGATVLAVSGWFTPDGAYEFGRVLEDWDRAVQDVTLLAMDVRSSGVSARWAIHVADESTLRRNLEAYLPQRGLTYAFIEDTAK